MFDPAYFGIKEEDAPHVDPMARLFLEECTYAVGHAGYAPKELWGKDGGFFVGSM